MIYNQYSPTLTSVHAKITFGSDGLNETVGPTTKILIVGVKKDGWGVWKGRGGERKAVVAPKTTLFRFQQNFSL